MFDQGFMFDFLQNVYVFMFCISPMRSTKDGSHHWHANVAITACICAGVGLPDQKIPEMPKSYFRMNMEGVNWVEELKSIQNLKREVRRKNALE